MLGQLIFNGNNYSICEVEGEGLFNPEEVGLRPVAISSAHGNGYTCKYSVGENYLQLLELGINELYSARIKVKYGKGKEVLGQKPRLDEFWGAYYENLDYKVNFTGRLLVGDDFIRDLPFGIGLQRAYRYKKVYELFFDGGNLFNTVDRSQNIAGIRQQEIKKNEEKSVNNNPAQEVIVDELGWVTCPNCDIRFATYDKSRYSWDGERHIGCKQLLILVYR